MARSVLLDKRKEEVMEIGIINPDKPAELKQYLNCTMLDAPVYKIGGRKYRIMVDDEGRPDDGIGKVSAVTQFFQPELYGNLLFFREKAGHLIGLEKEDIQNIRAHMRKTEEYGIVLQLNI